MSFEKSKVKIEELGPLGRIRKKWNWNTLASSPGRGDNVPRIISNKHSSKYSRKHVILFHSRIIRLNTI